MFLAANTSIWIATMKALVLSGTAFLVVACGGITTPTPNGTSSSKVSMSSGPSTTASIPSGSLSSSSSKASVTSSASLASSSAPSQLSGLIIQENEAGFCRVDGSAADSNNAGYTGSGFTNTNNKLGAAIVWSLKATQSTSYNLEITFANGGNAPRSGELRINTGSNGSYPVTLAATGAWEIWATETLRIDLNQGVNILELIATSDDGLANIDAIKIVGSGLTPGGCDDIAPPPVSSVPGSPGSPSSTSSTASSNGNSSDANSGVASGTGITPRASVKPRVIITTDGEIDDTSSMNRFLFYVSDVDLMGIVQVNGVQKDGHSKDKWVEKQIDQYENCLPNFKIHRPDYPSADYIRSVLTVGNENRDDLNKAPNLLSDSKGAQLIIKTLLDDDPRPVHILAWGGGNTQANAMWQIKDKYSAAEYQRAMAKVRLYNIWYQDGAGDWIEKNLPEVFNYEAGNVKDQSWRYVWDYMSVSGKYKGRDSVNPQYLQDIMDSPWLSENVKNNHGPLGAAYTQDYTAEGDTPSFMPLVDNGLEQHADYTLGGWGGRPVFEVGNHLIDAPDENNSGKSDFHWTFQRWLEAAQNDWAARNDWCVAAKYSDANHQPDAKVTGGLIHSVAAAATVNLDASATIDPDGDALTFKWWQYHEADSATAKVSINNANSKNNASFIVPNEPGKQVHIILEVSDNGSPVLTRYQRVIFNIQ